MNQEHYTEKNMQALEWFIALAVALIVLGLVFLGIESLMAECEIINYHLDKNWRVDYTSCKDLKHVWEK